MQLTPTFHIIRNVYTPKKMRKYTFYEVVQHCFDIVCETWQVTPTLLKSKSRKREYTVPRQVLAYLVFHYTDFSLKKVGREIGGRDHSTIIHAKQIVDELSMWDKVFKSKVDDCERYINSMHKRVK